MVQENSDEQIDDNPSFSAKVKKYFKNLFDFSNYNTKTIIYIIIFVALIIFSIALFIYNYFVDPTFLYSIVVNFFVNPILAIGVWGIFLFIGIMAIQGLIIPIPSEIVLLATGMIWGIYYGGIMGTIGSLAAGMLCFYISKKGGRPLAEKFVGKKAIKMADEIIEKYGIWAILISRMVPFIFFDPISYASGLVEMDTKKYSIGTLIGAIPRAFFFAWLGSLFGIDPSNPNIEAQSALFNIIFLIIIVVLGAIFIVYYLLAKYYGKKKILNK
ncbi:MAG: TVP38/TMEM64 family protein [Promethearchaeota archaeon]|nr:MAG: TVP38/TMEM64 family protein [Candidatus Lokiarchaeota archaeon]